jgi:HTH-type transcriptional regulator / antitoxin HigA
MIIKNERQLSATRAKLEKLEAVARTATGPDVEVWRALATQLYVAIGDYESVRDGSETEFVLWSIDDLADGLIKARISRGWTQRKLAAELGVAEQMVQKDEAGGYERASLARLADVCDALEYELSGCLSPRKGTQESQIASPLVSIGQGTNYPLEPVSPRAAGSNLGFPAGSRI